MTPITYCTRRMHIIPDSESLLVQLLHSGSVRKAYNNRCAKTNRRLQAACAASGKVRPNNSLPMTLSQPLKSRHEQPKTQRTLRDTSQCSEAYASGNFARLEDATGAKSHYGVRGEARTCM